MKFNSGCHQMDIGHAKGKYKCPKCGHKRFVLWTLNGNIISEQIGKCDRQETCGHELTVRAYAKSLGKEIHELAGVPLIKIAKDIEFTPTVIPPSYIDSKMVNGTISTLKEFKRGRSNLYNYFIPTMLVNGAKNTEVHDALDSFPLGTGKQGESIYWLKDRDGKFRSGKMIQYQEGKRVKDGRPAVWIHTELKLENFNLEQVFWGINRVEKGDIVVIVESEKSALLMTAALYLDEANRAELIGMCCGGAHYDYRNIKFVASGSSNGVAYKLEHKAVTKNKDLRGCTVYLLPDVFIADGDKRDPHDTHANWKDAADVMVKFSAISAECVPLRPEIIEKYKLEKGDDIWDCYLRMGNNLMIKVL